MKLSNAFSKLKYLHNIPSIPPVLNITMKLEGLRITTEEFSSHANTVQRHATAQRKVAAKSAWRELWL